MLHSSRIVPNHRFKGYSDAISVLGHTGSILGHHLTLMLRCLILSGEPHRQQRVRRPRLEAPGASGGSRRQDISQAREQRQQAAASPKSRVQLAARADIISGGKDRRRVCCPGYWPIEDGKDVKSDI